MDRFPARPCRWRRHRCTGSRWAWTELLQTRLLLGHQAARTATVAEAWEDWSGWNARWYVQELLFRSAKDNYQVWNEQTHKIINRIFRFRTKEFKINWPLWRNAPYWQGWLQLILITVQYHSYLQNIWTRSKLHCNNGADAESRVPYRRNSRIKMEKLDHWERENCSYWLAVSGSPVSTCPS